MTRPARPRRPATTLVPVDAEQAAALDRVRASFGPVEVLDIRAHHPSEPPGPGGVPMQGCLFAQEATG